MSSCIIEGEPGPALDETGGPPAEPPPTINDGNGLGVFRTPVTGNPWEGYRATLLVGAPTATALGSPGAGLVSAFASEPGSGLVTHLQFPETIFEDGASPICDGVSFARESFPNRSFGSAIGWFSKAIGADFLDYYNIVAVGAPTVSPDKGAVMQYGICESCAQFPTTDGSLDIEGDELGTFYGSAVAFGIFEVANVSGEALWRQNSTEFMAVGAPLWNVNGGVHIYSNGAYKHWHLFPNDANSSGERICNRTGYSLRARVRTLTGGFSNEEFGRTLAVADFTCDGFDDLAIGAPGADLPAAGEAVIEDAGAVHIFRGGPYGLGSEGKITLTQGMFGTEGEPEPGDRFGAVLAVGNFNGRRVDAAMPWSCWDLAVGTPNEDDEAGEVQIFYGHPADPGGIGPIIHPGENGLDGVRNAGDRFGASLVSFAFDDDGYHELAIGAPGDGGGRAYLIPGTSGDSDLSNATSFSQDTGTVPDDEDTEDEFGAALGVMYVETERALVIGAPGEDMSIGAVTVISVQKDTMGSFIAMGPGTTIRPSDVGLALAPGARWGEIIASPRAFPVEPTDYP